MASAMSVPGMENYCQATPQFIQSLELGHVAAFHLIFERLTHVLDVCDADAGNEIAAKKRVAFCN